ncbi:MmyB family transcriptional regulator [Streptomyces spiralis]
MVCEARDAEGTAGTVPRPSAYDRSRSRSRSRSPVPVPVPVLFACGCIGPGRRLARPWEAAREHEVAVRRATTKRFRHPAIGILELDCEILVNSDHNQQLVIHTARPGTES